MKSPLLVWVSLSLCLLFPRAGFGDSSSGSAAVLAPVEAAGPRVHWPPTARWRTIVTGPGGRASTYQFEMRLVGGAPEFRFTTVIGERKSHALMLGRGILWWLEGATLGLRYGSVAVDSAMPPAVFSEDFARLWKPENLGSNSVDGRSAIHLRGPFNRRQWDLWVNSEMDLPPLRMSSGSISYQNRDVEPLPPGAETVFSPPAGVDFRGPATEWSGAMIPPESWPTPRLP